MSDVPLPRPGSLGLVQYAGVDMHAHAAAVSAADNAALRDVIALAYGHLWCINTDRNVEAPVYTAEAAASTARRILRDTIDVEKRGDGITAALAALKGASHE